MSHIFTKNMSHTHMSRPDVVYVAVSGETLVAEQQMPQIRYK